MGKTFKRRPGDDDYDSKRRKFEHRRNKRIDNYNKKFGNVPVDDTTEKMKDDTNAKLYNS